MCQPIASLAKLILCGIVLEFIFVASCATVSTEKSASVVRAKTVQSEGFPPYSGERKRVQIIRFGIPQEIAAQYPELVEKRIGWGLYNMVLDELYDTKRFEFVEEKEIMRDRILQNWALSQTGLMAEEQQIDASKGLAMPQYLVYGEVFDFSISASEKITGIAMEKVNATQVGVQLRLVDVSNGEYIPGSGTAEATTTAKTVWAVADQPFDQSTVGLATKRAVHAAVFELLKRMQ